MSLHLYFSLIVGWPYCVSVFLLWFSVYLVCASLVGTYICLCDHLTCCVHFLCMLLGASVFLIYCFSLLFHVSIFFFKVSLSTFPLLTFLLHFVPQVYHKFNYILHYASYIFIGTYIHAFILNIGWTLFLKDLFERIKEFSFFLTWFWLIVSMIQGFWFIKTKWPIHDLSVLDSNQRIYRKRMCKRKIKMISRKFTTKHICIGLTKGLFNFLANAILHLLLI